MSLEETIEKLLRKVVREELQALAGADRLLTAEQVADTLGLTSVDSVRRLKREKKLPFVVLGDNSYRFKQSDVQKFIDERVQ